MRAPWLVTATGVGLLFAGMSCVGFFGSAMGTPLSTYLWVCSVATGLGAVLAVGGDLAILCFMTPLPLKFGLCLASGAVAAYTTATVFGIMETYRVGTDPPELLAAPFGLYFASWIVCALCVLSHASIALLAGVAIVQDRRCAVEAPHLCPTLAER